MKSMVKKFNNAKVKPIYRKILSWLVNLFIGILFLNLLFFNEFSLTNLIRTKFENQRLKQEVSKINRENLLIQKENIRLANDPKAIEKIAREKYGMHKTNEKVYRFYSEDEEEETN